MPQTLSNIMVQNVTTVGVDDTVEDVECILGSHKYSCVPVVDPEGQCFGIVTSNDILKFHRMSRNAKRVRAWEICSHLLIEVSPSLSIKEAGILMIKNKIHHLVVSEDKTIRGIVSSIDLLEAYITANPS
ncbi:MAG: CBS domain-containing protein [Desulfobulbaceae bacterium]|jgi:signal-transduction protein with cAMP-binding, CBS, and nucleotidyltransferase domain|nr:CBS domain-containing protein [Desulfobulbaceae bacterium]